MPSDYDVIIIGGGAAGLSAGMYAARYGLKTGILEQLMGGGQVINAERIENFPGFAKPVSGAEFSALLQEQAMDAGAEFLMGESTGLVLDGQHRVVTTYDEPYRAKTIIIATGSSTRSLGIPGEEEMVGSGVSHCATCDGPLFKNEVVGVVGGGDAAADEALTLTEYTDNVILFHRRDALRAHKTLRDRVVQHPDIELVYNTVVEEVSGEGTVNGVRVRNLVTNLVEQVNLTGLFVYVGTSPNSNFVQGVVKTDNAGHIPVNVKMETEVPGIYAAGDIRQHSVAQLAAAAGDGVTAAVEAYRYISGQTWN